MATDIYLSRAVHEQYYFANECHGQFGDVDFIELFHSPCEMLICSAREDSKTSSWIFMEAMSKHNRECPAGRLG